MRNVTFTLMYSCLLSFLFLNGCSNDPEMKNEEIVTRDQRKYQGYGKFFGEEAFLFGESKVEKEPDVGIGVNTYLWRASLDTLSFMPLKSVDPFGGVILTEWYTPSHAPHERLKVDVRILDRVLRADGLRISVFRQVFEKGQWVDKPVALETAQSLEDAILTKARQLKIDAGK